MDANDRVVWILQLLFEWKLNRNTFAAHTTHVLIAVVAVRSVKKNKTERKKEWNQELNKVAKKRRMEEDGDINPFRFMTFERFRRHSLSVGWFLFRMDSNRKIPKRPLPIYLYKRTYNTGYIIACWTFYGRHLEASRPQRGGLKLLKLCLVFYVRLKLHSKIVFTICYELGWRV